MADPQTTHDLLLALQAARELNVRLEAAEARLVAAEAERDEQKALFIDAFASSNRNASDAYKERKRAEAAEEELVAARARLRVFLAEHDADVQKFVKISEAAEGRLEAAGEVIGEVVAYCDDCDRYGGMPSSNTLRDMLAAARAVLVGGTEP